MEPFHLELMYEEEQAYLRFQLSMEKRMLRNDINPWMLPDKEFKKRFRLDKECYRLLLDELTPHMEEGERNTRLSMDVRILAALAFFATGSYQKTIGDSYKIAVSQQSISKVLSEVLVAMEQIAPRWIRFPIDDEEQRRIKHGFMETFNFPGVIGCIDCSHIAILQPLEDEHIYFNRKGFHSKNVQLICDSRMTILNVNANFGGSTHDAFIWRNSRIYQFMENLYQRGNQVTWLLGDSGYPQQPWLLTPIANTFPGTPERAYVDAHTTTRNIVERCIELLKTRFRCLLKERVMRYTPHKAGQIINACCVLHNMCIRGNVPLDEPLIVEDDIHPDPDEDDAFIPLNIVAEGQRRRREIINMYFH